LYRKSVDSLGVVVPVQQGRDHGCRFPQEVLAFRCGFESFMAGAIGRGAEFSGSG
jgi:hypothetical protein